MKHIPIIITALAALTTPVVAQVGKPNPGPVDPFAANKARAGLAAVEDPAAQVVNLSLAYELFSLPLADAAALMRQGLGDEKLYEEVLTRVTAKTARQEALTVTRLRSGQQVSSTAATEHIYPTEYDPPELPSQVGVLMTRAGKDDPTPAPDLDALRDAPSRDALGALVTPATPTTFQTRMIGTILEADASFDSKTGLIDLMIRPEHVALVGRIEFGQGVSTVTMPEIESQDLSTSVAVKPSTPHLLGTMNRPPVSKLKADSANEIWFAFATVTLVEP